MVSYSALWFHKIFKLYKWKAYYLHRSTTRGAALLCEEWIRDISLHIYLSVALHKSLVLILLMCVCVCFMFHRGKSIKCHWQKCKLFGIQQSTPLSCWLKYSGEDKNKSACNGNKWTLCLELITSNNLDNCIKSRLWCGFQETECWSFDTPDNYVWHFSSERKRAVFSTELYS